MQRVVERLADVGGWRRWDTSPLPLLYQFSLQAVQPSSPHLSVRTQRDRLNPYPLPFPLWGDRSEWEEGWGVELDDWRARLEGERGEDSGYRQGTGLGMWRCLPNLTLNEENVNEMQTICR